ncbi:hypothetical protein [Streptomyces lydicamycinicus]|uniref:hypothetical protein n=1 Tax=Streptomyces lydicamycinicus TaxID=1546107 RepID=UPI003C302F7B
MHDVQEGMRDAWEEHAPAAREAMGDIRRSAVDGAAQAVEVGAMIGDAIADRLPPGPTEAARKRGLDLRWLRLELNIPGLVIAGAAWRWGIGPAETAVGISQQDGPLAPAGWVLLVVMLLGALTLLPVGSHLASAVAHLVTALSGALWRGLARAWHARVLGYVLRLAADTVAWVLIIGFVRLIWRALVTWLTGV